MVIKIHREIDVPDKFICNHGRKDCWGLYDKQPDRDHAKCAEFNSFVFWSDKAGFYVRCNACIEAHMEHLRN